MRFNFQMIKYLNKLIVINQCYKYQLVLPMWQMLINKGIKKKKSQDKLNRYDAIVNVISWHI